MASAIGKACSGSSSQMSPPTEKGSRNKRKFRADPPTVETTKIVSQQLNDCSSYEFSAEKFDINPNHTHSNGCDLCSDCQDHSDTLKLNLGLSCAIGAQEAGPSSSPKEEIAPVNEFHDADWSDLTESQLEELVLCNLDTIFKSAIKKIVECGYDGDVATKAVLRSGLCYGFKDTVSNIVDNTLAFLKNGQEVVDPSKEHYFEDLQQMEKYILAELVCVLREVRPFFSTGDAMWCLLICDMNVSLACSLDTDPFNIGEGDTNGTSAVSSQTESKSSENVANPSKLNQSDAHSSQSEAPIVASVSNTKPKSSFVLNGLVNEKEGQNGQNSPLDTVDKSFSVVGTSQSHEPEEKFIGSRKLSGITKREYILRQKSIRLEKSYRTYGSKGASRSGKLSTFGGLMLDKKLKSVSDSGLNVKNTSLKITKAMGNNIGLSSPATFGLENVSNTISTSPRNNINPPPALSAAETELSLAIPAKTLTAPVPVSCSPEAPSPVGQWIPQDKKDEMIMKLVPRVKDLQSQLQEWTEWANQKVMQAARRLSKDKAELKTLRQEREEVERLKREKQTLEESTMKKLCEMENALCKASGQVERANASVRRLEVENEALRQQMEGAKLRATESAASCQEAAKREKKTLMNLQSWEKQKSFLQEELVAEKRKLGQLKQELEQAKDVRDQLEAKWKQEEEAKESLLTQANTIKKDREKIEASAKLKEEGIRLKAEKNLQRYKDDIQKLEKEISQLRLKTDSSKIAALKRGATDCKTGPSPNESQILYISKMVKDFKEYSASGGVKRERECVMCLSEEMSVVFLPCAHQVVCSSCNELHEKQGMKECPSCRGPIQRRISVRYASS